MERFDKEGVNIKYILILIAIIVFALCAVLALTERISPGEISNGFFTGSLPVVALLLLTKGVYTCCNTVDSTKETRKTYGAYSSTEYSPSIEDLEERLEGVIEISNKTITKSSIYDILLSIIMIILITFAYKVNS